VKTAPATIAKPGPTKAERLKARRLELKATAEAERDQRNEAFEALGEEGMQAISESIETIKDTFGTAMESAEEDATYEANLELETLVEKYGYDAVKSYVEDFGNGDEEYDAQLDLNLEIDNL
jgi:hypothetical protein